MKNLFLFMSVAIFSGYTLQPHNDLLSRVNVPLNAMVLLVTDLAIETNALEFKLKDEFKCTLYVKIYFLTEAGLIGVGVSITSDTCEHVLEGRQEAMAPMCGVLTDCTNSIRVGIVRVEHSDTS